MNERTLIELMQEPLTYSLDHSGGTVNLTLVDQRFIAKTQGRGLLDKPRVVDITLTDLKQFCVVPTIAVQNLASYTTEPDRSYDSEFIFSYREGERLKRKRLFVNSRDESFRTILQELEQKCPSASLLSLSPTEAQKQIGAISASKTIYLFVGLLVAVPILIAIIFIIFKIFA